jgi:hypothetical protein
MAELKRNSRRLKHPGPYLALVKNHLDPEFNGGLEVSLIKGYVDNSDYVEGELIPVQYLSPFAGTTSIDYVTKGANDFNSTQKSYGMWMVPPDVGTTVMVFFIEGYASQGYWFGCVPDSNNMIPGIASIPLPPNALSPEELTFYGNDPLDSTAYNLPVAEINRKLNNEAGNIINYPPVHTFFAQQLVNQGLLYDRVRGASSSSARRETPSQVFGISTPGPLDVTTNNYQCRSDSYGGVSLESNKFPSSRMGGNQFVMDDGDIFGNNELIRIRTRKGIEVLLHNTKDLVYITNSNGTAWIEMTSQGKIDIYAHDSISMHTEVDFNLRAGRNFNIEAGNNVNIKSFGNLNIDVNSAMSASVGTDLLLTSTGGKLVVSAKGAIGLNSGDSILAKAPKEFGATAGVVNLTGPTNINGGLVSQSARLDEASVTSATAPDATSAPKLTVVNKVKTDIAAGWSNNVQYSAGFLPTTMARVPMHEPWAEHEDLNPILYSSGNTDNGSPVAPVSAEFITANKPTTPWTPSSTNPAIQFGSDTGDKLHFAKLTSAMQEAVYWAANIYYARGQGSLTIMSAFRSPQEQQALVAAFKAAGGSYDKGSPNNTVYTPRYGHLTTPSSDSLHSRGTAVDIPVTAATWLLATGVLAQLGLSRPFPHDPGHIQMG